jgi:23S rRNA pseudouridine2605 synthase
VTAEVNDSVGDLAATGAVEDTARSFQPREPRAAKPSFAKPREYKPREYKPRGESSDARPPRKTFSKPGTFGRKREGFGGRPAFGTDARPPRKDFAARSDRRPDRGERPAFGSPRAPGSYAPRPSGGAGFSGKPGFSKDKPTRKPFAKKTFGEKPFAGKPRDGGESGKRVYRKFDAPRDRPARPFSSDRPARPTFSDRPARPTRGGGAGEAAGRSPGDFAPRKFAGKKPFGKPGGFAGKKPFGKSSGKPGGFAGKKPFGKPGSAKPGASFTGKPSSTFAKFADNKKPFGKRAPARKYKPREDESA